MDLDINALLIGLIPGMISVLTLWIQIRKEKAKDKALVSKTRAEEMASLATAADTLAEAGGKIIERYERIIELLEEEHRKEIGEYEARIEQMEREANMDRG